MNHNVPSRENLLAVQPYDFAKTAPDAIAYDGSAQRFLDAPSKTAAFEAIRSEENGELAV